MKTLFYHIFIIVFFLNATVLFLLAPGRFGPFIVFEYNNSLVCAVEQYNESYSAGDVIAYYIQTNGEEAVRIHSIDRLGGNVYIVNNRIVLPRLIIGKVALKAPHVGKLLLFAKSYGGMVVFLYIPALIILLVEARWQWKQRKKVARSYLNT